jgi:hypothetical protein
MPWRYVSYAKTRNRAAPCVLHGSVSPPQEPPATKRQSENLLLDNYLQHLGIGLLCRGGKTEGMYIHDPTLADLTLTVIQQ